MSNNIFDLEQQLLSCWHVTDDIKLAAEYFINSTDFKDLPPKYSDKIMNILFGIQEVYELRFQKCFETFEKTVPRNITHLTILERALMKCYSCKSELIWGADHDIDHEEDEHAIMTELTCCGCGAFVNWGDKEDVLHSS
jgi:hypothetical protein